MSKRIKLVIIILIVITLAGITAWWMLKNTEVSNPAAEIYSNGQLIYTLPLHEDKQFTIESSNGSNTVEIIGGKVRVIHASCPDKVCIATGSASAGVPIICLPNRLEIRIVSGESGLDGQIR